MEIGSVDRRRGWLGFGLGLVPHLALLVLMLVLAAGTAGDGWAYVAYYGFLEVYLAPIGLLTALVLCLWKPLRPAGAGAAAAAVLGFVMIACCTFVLGRIAG
jgi:hypothetical protein